MTKYKQLVDQIKNQIQSGVWAPGDKLPSLRKQTQYSGLSLMTVLHAYQVLESQGWLVSNNRSGYCVAAEIINKDTESATRSVESIESVQINDFVFDVLQQSRLPDHINFSLAYPDPALFPRQHVNNALVEAARSMTVSSTVDNFPPGNEDLRKLIAQRYAASNMPVSPEEIVITAGSLEALNLSLQAVTKPGDWVIVESPAFYGALQSIERLGLKALAIRTHEKEGIDLAALEKALQSYPVKACWLMSYAQNPLGFSLSLEKKQKLIDLLQRYDAYLIEDDVYRELYFGDQKPTAIKALDTKGIVLHCSSFSKCLVAGYRIGWVAAGKQALSIQRLQLMSTLSTSAPIQQAIVIYLSTRNYEAHLRQLRLKLKQRRRANYEFLAKHWPPYVKLLNQDEGYFLWVELPNHFDATQLYYQALAQHIVIAPGKMFSSNNKFSHCFRLNLSFELSDARKNALLRLGQLIQQMSEA